MSGVLVSSDILPIKLLCLKQWFYQPAAIPPGIVGEWGVFMVTNEWCISLIRHTTNQAVMPEAVVLPTSSYSPGDSGGVGGFHGYK